MIRNTCKRFCNITYLAMSKQSYVTSEVASLQKAAMLKERCLLVDRSDKPIGQATKEACHELNAEGTVPLHRAFSVFLFNSKGELLLQKRSSNKITFPDCFTNTCCSHPLVEVTPSEMEEENVIGVRRAAIRRLGYELGIPSTEVKPFDLVYLTRIYYEAASDERWGEHEIDYIFFLKKDKLTINPNPDEVSEVRWVSRSEIKNFIKATPLLTPWFRLIYQEKLLQWWDNLNDLSTMHDPYSILGITN